MVYDYDSSKKNKRVTDGAPPKINVTPIQVSPKFIVEIFKSELKFNLPKYSVFFFLLYWFNIYKLTQYSP